MVVFSLSVVRGVVVQFARGLKRTSELYTIAREVEKECGSLPWCTAVGGVARGRPGPIYNLHHLR